MATEKNNWPAYDKHASEAPRRDLGPKDRNKLGQAVDQELIEEFSKPKKK